jgi:hypothetical protein
MDRGTWMLIAALIAAGCQEVVPETEPACLAESCMQEPGPPPDPALLVLDPVVMNDPAFSLQAMHDRLAEDGNGSALFEQWAETLAEPLVLNQQVADPRPGFTAFAASIPKNAAGFADLDQAGFLPSALVNRVDLRTPGNCGESRVVYTKVSGLRDGGNRMTIIFEFGVPDDGAGCRTAARKWAALRGLEGDALRHAAVALMLEISQREQLNQMRINEFIAAIFWELREFHLVDGALEPSPVADTPAFAAAAEPAFRQFVVDNASRFDPGARETGILPPEMLAPASLADGTRLDIGDLVPSIPDLETKVNIITCSGCHLTETAAAFVHVAERPVDAPSTLSLFMAGELELRAGEFEAVLGRND